MKIAPVSADLLIKLGILASIGFGLYLISQSATKAASALASSAGQAVDAVILGSNPADSQNIINRAVTAVGKTATGDDAWTLGGSIYDLKERLFG